MRTRRVKLAVLKASRNLLYGRQPYIDYWFARATNALDPNHLRRRSSFDLARDERSATGVFGEKYLVDVNDHIGFRLFLGIQPPAISRLISERLLRSGSFNFSYWDVGANVGSTVIPVALLGVPTVAIEPVPSNLESLRRNARLNGLRIEIVEAALSDPGSVQRRGGKVTVYLRPGNLGACSVNPEWNPGADDPGPITVPITTLDDLVVDERNCSPGLIKVDAEGHEASILRGGKQVLATHKPLLLLEWAARHHRDPVTQWAEVAAALPPAYKPFQVAMVHALNGDRIVRRIEIGEFSPTNDYEDVLLCTQEHIETLGLAVR